MKNVLLNDLIDKFSQFPGVGRKTAERFAFYVINSEPDRMKELTDLIQRVKSKINNCKICNNLTEEDICAICRDKNRNSALLCVVEQPKDLLAIEKTGYYKGKYFVLLGALSPLEGIGPEDIKIKELLEHIKNHSAIKEIIISTDADAEGESTAHYLIKILKPLGRKLTRIGLGLPVGADLEFVDRNTLQEALRGRREV